MCAEQVRRLPRTAPTGILGVRPRERGRKSDGRRQLVCYVNNRPIDFTDARAFQDGSDTRVIVSREGVGSIGIQWVRIGDGDRGGRAVDVVSRSDFGLE